MWHEFWQVYQQEQLSLAGLVDLRHLPNLHVFTILSNIRWDAPEPVVLRDIRLVLSTIPRVNQVTKLSLDFIIYCQHPFSKCLEEDWVGMCDEVVRISAGKPLEFNLEMSITTARLGPSSGRDEFYERIKEKMASLSKNPNICTHFCHPHHNNSWSRSVKCTFHTLQKEGFDYNNMFTNVHSLLTGYPTHPLSESSLHSRN